MTKYSKYSKLWFLQDTIDFYNLNNRSVTEDGVCQYKMDDKKCAIGRYLTGYVSSMEGEIVGDLIRVYNEYLPKWMLKFNPRFLQRVQIFHDDRHNWTSTGLSKEGIDTVKFICKKHRIKFKELTIKQ